MPRQPVVDNEPELMYWSYQDVVNWIVDLGFPQYANCFRNNFIDGKKLILINGSTLPKMGIQDYEHIKIISKDLKDKVLKMGEWNTMRIRVVGDQIESWLNGISMISLKDEKIGQGKGSIALQIHDGGGIKVKWRNLLVTPL